MTHKMKYIGMGAIAALMLLSVFITAKANPSFFLQQPSSSATTTPIAFMTAGAATSTYPSATGFDMGAGAAQGADSAVLMSCFMASSTLSVLNTAIEYSQDSLTWAQDDLATSSTAFTVFQMNPPRSFTWQFASSTIGGAGLYNVQGVATTSAGIVCKVITVPTPTRYVRAIFSLPGGSTNGAVWANFIAKRQAN